jgi:peptide/nickel transport system permease protein
MIETKSTKVIELQSPQIGSSDTYWRKALRHIRRDKLTMTALFVLATLILLAVFAPMIVRILDIEALETETSQRMLPLGTSGHIFGTDNVGRDVFARMLFAAQISLSIGFFGAMITLSIGTALGMLTGYVGGVFDDFINWIITTLDSLPTLYLLIAVSALLRPSPQSLILIIAVTGWTGGVRLIRGQTLAIKNLDYILASQALGASTLRVLFVHILPNLTSILVISLTLGIGGTILAESGLSFLNLGVQPPTPTWGNMLSDAQSYFRTAGHLLIIPGLAIFITVLCLYILGDGLRDALDPTSQNA